MKYRVLVTALLACLLVVFNACDSDSRRFDPSQVLDPGDFIDNPVPDGDDDDDDDDETFPDGDDDDDDDTF